MSVCEHCGGNATGRKAVGPTGRNYWMLRVDECYYCSHLNLRGEATAEQKDWLRRYNARTHLYVELESL